MPEATPEPPRCTIVTAFSVDYPPGHLCAARNRHYAERHGYDFRCWTDSNLAMAETIARCPALTWCKVHAINEALRAAADGALVLWIDADALVTNVQLRLEEVHVAHGAPDLLVAKDVTPTCLINAGVLLVRNCEWSRSLFSELWEGAAAKGLTFLHKKFHEQSRLEQLLRRDDPSLFEGIAAARERWLEPGVRRGVHTAVCDGIELNTRELSPPPRFIFHACGNTKGHGKAALLRRACAEHGGEALGTPPFEALPLLRPRAARDGGGDAPLRDEGLAALSARVSGGGGDDGGVVVVSGSDDRGCGGGGGVVVSPPAAAQSAHWMPHLDVADCALTMASTGSLVAAVRAGVWSVRAAGNQIDLGALLAEPTLRHLDASRCELLVAEGHGEGGRGRRDGDGNGGGAGGAGPPDAPTLFALIRRAALTHLDLTGSLPPQVRAELLALLCGGGGGAGVSACDEEVAHPFIASGRGRPPAMTYWVRFGKEAGRRTVLL